MFISLQCNAVNNFILDAIWTEVKDNKVSTALSVVIICGVTYQLLSSKECCNVAPKPKKKNWFWQKDKPEENKSEVK